MTSARTFQDDGDLDEATRRLERATFRPHTGHAVRLPATAGHSLPQISRR